MKLGLIYCAFLLSACNTFTDLERDPNNANNSNNRNNANNQNNANNANNANNSNNENNQNNANNTNNTSLQFFDDSLVDDWFIRIGLDLRTTDRLRSISLVENGNDFIAGTVRDDDLFIATTFSRPQSEFAGGWGRSETLVSTPPLNTAILVRETSSIDLVTAHNLDNSALGSYITDIFQAAPNTTSFLETNLGDGVNVAYVGSTRQGKDTLGSSFTVIQANDEVTVLPTNGMRFNWDTTSLDSLITVPLGAGQGRFITTKGPLGIYRTGTDTVTFDPRSSNSFEQFLNGTAFDVIGLAYIGIHGGNPEFAVASFENQFSVSIRRNLTLTQVESLSMEIPEVDSVSLIDVVSYYHPDDDDSAGVQLNPANVVVVTAEEELNPGLPNLRYVAFRAFRITNSAFDMISCRRLRVGVSKLELAADAYPDGNDLVVGAATIYVDGGAQERNFGIDGIRFPGLFVPDEQINPPFDTTCQSCWPFDGNQADSCVPN